MKKTVLAVMLAAGVAIAAGIQLDSTTQLQITNCLAAGSADAGAGLGNTLATGDWLFRAMQEDVDLCFNVDSGTLSDGGPAGWCLKPEPFPMGTVMSIRVKSATTVMCRSAGATGDALFTRILNN